MRAYLIFVLTSLIFTSLSAKEPKWKRLYQAYGFIAGQNMSITRVEEDFPDLRKGLQLARFEFNSSSIGEGAKALEDSLMKDAGKHWVDLKAKMHVELKAQAQLQSIDREDAEDFIQDLRKRSKGDIPESILRTLLSVNPRFVEQPALELWQGYIQTYRTKGHPKAKKLDLSISLPTSWESREGFRPNIVQVFQSDGGYGPIQCTILVNELPLPEGYTVTKDDLEEIFQAEELRDMVPEGGRFIRSSKLVIENQPAGLLVFDQEQERMDMKMESRSVQFVSAFGAKMFFIQFYISDAYNEGDTLDNLEEKYLPLFMAIANTTIINSKY
jgi:hypothetical protein